MRPVLDSVTEEFCLSGLAPIPGGPVNVSGVPFPKAEAKAYYLNRLQQIERAAYDVPAVYNFRPETVVARLDELAEDMEMEDAEAPQQPQRPDVERIAERVMEREAPQLAGQRRAREGDAAAEYFGRPVGREEGPQRRRQDIFNIREAGVRRRREAEPEQVAGQRPERRQRVGAEPRRPIGVQPGGAFARLRGIPNPIPPDPIQVEIEARAADRERERGGGMR